MGISRVTVTVMPLPVAIRANTLFAGSILSFESSAIDCAPTNAAPTKTAPVEAKRTFKFILRTLIRRNLQLQGLFLISFQTGNRELVTEIRFCSAGGDLPSWFAVEEILRCVRH